MAPSPEELAAFLDGELDPALRVQVEEWLAEHPEESADLEELSRLCRMVQATAPAEPAEAAWSAVLDRIEAAAAHAREVQFWRRAVVVGTAAAVLLLAFLLSPHVGRGPGRPGEPAELLVLASHDDIEIISMNGGDTSALIVGYPPLREPLVLADPEDISIDGVEPDSTSGMMPNVRWVPGGGEAPVVVAGILPQPEEDE
jgi:anti-sigma factor RsiW